MSEKKYYLTRSITPDPDRPYFTTVGEVEVSKEEYEKEYEDRFKEEVVDEYIEGIREMVRLCKRFLTFTGTDHTKIHLSVLKKEEFWDSYSDLRPSVECGRCGDSSSRIDLTFLKIIIKQTAFFTKGIENE